MEIYRAWYKDVSPDADARVIIRETDDPQDARELDLKPAKVAFKEAVDAEKSGAHDSVTVWVEGLGQPIDMANVTTIYEAWVKEGLA
jgi:hypothetical protein